MKKILFATTALVATTGMAAADISFGGFGRFGLLYVEDAAEETRVEQRFRLTVTGVTESDAGVKFEGRIRFQTDDNAAGNSSVAKSSAPGFAVTSGSFRLDVGNVSNVADSGDAVNIYGYGVGMTGFADNSSGQGMPASGFGTGDDDSERAATVKLRYSAGDLTVAASYTDNDDEQVQLGVGYSFGDYSVGIMFADEDTDDREVVAASLGGEIGALAFNLLIADSDALDDTGYSLSVKYEMSASTELRFAYSDGGNDADEEAYGIGFIHQLGGGVSLRGGVGENTDGDTVADLGVVFNF